MRLKYTFLSRVVILTIAALLCSNASHAGPDSGFDMNDFAKSSYQKNIELYNNYRKIEDKILNDPIHALDTFFYLINKKDINNGIIDLTTFDFVLQYSENLPKGEVTDLKLIPKEDRATILLTVHKSSQTNPFVNLEALLMFNRVKRLKEIGSVKSTIKPGKSIEHDGFDAINSQIINISDSLGINSSSSFFLPPGPDNTISMSIIQYMELKANALGGSPISKHKLKEIDIQEFQVMKDSFDSFLALKGLTESQKKAALFEYATLKGLSLSNSSYDSMLKSFIDAVDTTLKKELTEITLRAQTTYQAQINEYKKDSEKRDTLVTTKSLPDMVKANDREGVADAMNTMLPWSIMEPTEKSFWTDFVESIRHPNYTNAPVLFRGMDYAEKLQPILNQNGQVVSGALFSKRLTAGSGSHLYKLKGLPGTFETFGSSSGEQLKRLSPLVMPHTLTRMMINHADNPAGSPFISLTYDLSVAFKFAEEIGFDPKNKKDINAERLKYLNSNASGGVVAVRIDPRRLITNSISTTLSELEVLASMLIFPDEVLYMEKGIYYRQEQSGKTSEQAMAEFYNKVRTIVLKNTGKEIPATWQIYSKDTGKAAFASGINSLENRFEEAANIKKLMCSKVFN